MRKKKSNIYQKMFRPLKRLNNMETYNRHYQNVINNPANTRPKYQLGENSMHLLFSKNCTYTIFKIILKLVRRRPLRILFAMAAVGLMCTFGVWEHLNEISFENIDASRTFKQSLFTSMTAKPINPHPFVYTNLPDEHFVAPNVFILIIVKSSTGHFQHRSDIRKSWASDQYYKLNGYLVQTVFMLGQPPDDTLTPKLRTEMNLHGDIVQENFQDTYFNNTYKTIMSFNWAAEYSQQAKYFLFVDDDYLVIVDNVLHYLKNASDHSLFIGYLKHGDPPVRQWHSKWYISLEEYPYSLYPPFISGGAFIVSRDLVKLFARAFPFTKSFRFDDVYLGFVAYKLGVKLQNDGRFLIDQPSDWKIMANKIAAHYNVDYKKMISDWDKLEIK